jgi:steroid Delta-isomerase
MSTETSRLAVARLVRWFESLQIETLRELERHYAPDARFKDPFNDVRGTEAIAGIFRHMFASLHEPRFVVTQQLVDGDQAFLVWTFHFRFRRFDTVTSQVIAGGTHLTLAADGRVLEHRDYWDAAEELYEKLPAVGSVMRWLKRRASQ